MKKIILMISCLTIFSLLISCEKVPESSSSSSSPASAIQTKTKSSPKESPKEILTKFLDASLYGNPEEAYQYISQKDKAIKNKEDYLAENSREGNPFFETFSSKITYEINELTTESNKSSASVTITMPDFASVFAELLGTAFKTALSGDENQNQDEQFEKMMADKFKDGNIPTTSEIERYTLLKEEGGWEVFLDWEKEKDEAEKKQKVDELLAEAKELTEKKKLNGALQKYEEVLELDSNIVEAKEGKKETEKSINKFKEKQEYIANVELYDLTSAYYTTYLDKQIPGVVFKIKNKGDRTLTKVKVTVYFKDSKGSFIAEEDYHPVLVSSYSSSSNKPLKPNYIWQIERGKFLKAESVPSEWVEGSVSAKVTDIEFE